MSSEDINFKELWTISKRLVPDLAHTWAGRRILVRCDNTTAVPYLNSRRGQMPKLLKLLDGLEELEKRYKFGLVAVHIRGKDNVIADAGSHMEQ